MASLKKILKYWQSPDDGDNSPEFYLNGWERSLFLANTVRRYVAKDEGILEIGCNVGRNLVMLHNMGYRNLSGIEISPSAVEIFAREFPYVYSDSMVFRGAVEDTIEHVPDQDLIFTVATLEHIHKDSEWVFAEIVKKCDILVTVEDEAHTSWRHFPRCYRQVFEDLGMIELERQGCRLVPGFTRGFVMRVFTKD